VGDGRVRERGAWRREIVRIGRAEYPVTWNHDHSRDVAARLRAADGGANEQWLKYGTAETSLEVVCEAVEGMDYLHCAAGMMSKGAYCAEDAKYPGGHMVASAGTSSRAGLRSRFWCGWQEAE